MKMNKSFFLIGAAMAILVTTGSQLTETFAQQSPDETFGQQDTNETFVLEDTDKTVAQQDTNITGIESKLKSVQPEGGLMRSAAPGDLVFVLVCPPDFDSVIEDCQMFQGSPVQ
jgi:hypothetical protein